MHHVVSLRSLTNMVCALDGRGSERLGGGKKFSWGEEQFSQPFEGGTESLGLGGGVRGK